MAYMSVRVVGIPPPAVADGGAVTGEGAGTEFVELCVVVVVVVV
jgi:hypothetical protein